MCLINPSRMHIFPRVSTRVNLCKKSSKKCDSTRQNAKLLVKEAFLENNRFLSMILTIPKLKDKKWPNISTIFFVSLTKILECSNGKTKIRVRRYELEKRTRPVGILPIGTTIRYLWRPRRLHTSYRALNTADAIARAISG